MTISKLPNGANLTVKISNQHGHDYEQNMHTVSVGEAHRRFTAEQLNDWTAVQQFINECLTHLPGAHT